MNLREFREAAEQAAAMWLTRNDRFSEPRSLRAFELVLGAWGWMRDEHLRFLHEVEADQDPELFDWWVDRFDSLLKDIVG